ncbi:enoyl-CoA hydratase-related protein [Microbacterium sp. LWH7-1.2]|uniref:enoyl-CoA hydratase/isomerase family protein n=1 Tax=Microbacterium sp. LWH7-1.2 TaxID=3135257 RepID=UPI0031391F3C
MDERSLLRTSAEGAVLVLTLDDAETRNAFTPTLRDQLAGALAAAVEDDSIRAVVLTGAGRGFCSGGNTRAMGTVTEAQKRASMLRTAEFVEQLVTFPKPVVAAVHGYAVGAGIPLALACDVVVAEQSTRFIVGFTALGLVPDLGAHFFLVQALGPRGAKRLLWSDGEVDADEAHRRGLVDELAGDGDGLSRAVALASGLAAGPTLAMGATKRIIADADLDDLRRTLRAEAEASARLRSSEDHIEGVAALREKRRARFTGR